MKRKGYANIEQFRGKLKPHFATSTTSAKEGDETDNSGAFAVSLDNNSFLRACIAVLIAVIFFLLQLKRVI